MQKLLNSVLVEFLFSLLTHTLPYILNILWDRILQIKQYSQLQWSHLHHFHRYFSLNDLTWFVHLMLLYEIVKQNFKSHISLYFIFISILSWLPSLEAKKETKREDNCVPDVEDRINETRRSREVLLVDWKQAVRVSVKRREGGDWGSESQFPGVVLSNF